MPYLLLSVVLIIHSLIFFSLYFQFSLFGLNFNNRLSQRMHDAAIVHLSKGIERNGENGGALETLNLTRNLMNLASSPGNDESVA